MTLFANWDNLGINTCLTTSRINLMSDQAKIDEEDLSIEEILSSIRQIISEEDEEETTENEDSASNKEKPKAESKPSAKQEESAKGEDDLNDKQSQDDIDALMAEADAQAAQDAEDNLIDVIEDDASAGADTNQDETDDVLELDTPVEEGEQDTGSDKPDVSNVEVDMRDVEEETAQVEVGDTQEDTPAEEGTQELSPPQTAQSQNVEDSDLLSETAAAASMASLSKLGRRAAIERPEETREGALTLEDMARDMMKPMLKEWLDAHLPGIIEKMVEKELRRLSRNIDDE